MVYFIYLSKKSNILLTFFVVKNTWSAWPAFSNNSRVTSFSWYSTPWPRSETPRQRTRAIVNRNVSFFTTPSLETSLMSLELSWGSRFDDWSIPRQFSFSRQAFADTNTWEGCVPHESLPSLRTFDATPSLWLSAVNLLYQHASDLLLPSSCLSFHRGLLRTWPILARDALFFLFLRHSTHLGAVSGATPSIYRVDLGVSWRAGKICSTTSWHPPVSARTLMVENSN